MSKQINTTVVIPCYNDGAFIQEAIDSVNLEKSETVEIIIVDDASTDEETLTLLKKLNQDNITVHFLEKNGGPSIARNKGISLAKGKYILPLDADDKIDRSYIEKAEQILDNKSNIGIVYCNATFFGNKHGKWDLPEYHFPTILVGNMIFATALYRKSDWEKVGGYNQNMKYGNEDYDFWLSLLELGRDVYKIPETLFYYRIKEDSRTVKLHKNHKNEIDTYVQMFHNHQDLYLKNIDIFFKSIKKSQIDLLEKDDTIRDIHQRLSSKDTEIKSLHKTLQGKDTEIQSLHQSSQDKDTEIQSLHKSSQDKDTEIQSLHQSFQDKDTEIQSLHETLERKNNETQQLGNSLTYAREIVTLRDEQIEFLKSLTLKRRFKHQIKKYIPNSLLKLLGFSAYAPLVIPTRDIEEPNSPELSIEKPLVYTYTEPLLTHEIQNEMKSFSHTPLISIIMPVYNVDPKWLDLAIKSIENQWYPHWELCLADDKSTNDDIIAYLKNINNPKIKVTFLEKNVNISGASNAALSLATGEYIALMDNDDEITPDALFQMVKAIQSGADFIYSDEDFVSIDGEYSNPHFKPDFSPDLLLSHNYITHFTCFKKSLLDKVGYFNAAFDGAQDYDLFLRLTEQTAAIHHIQKVLYHWRTLESSTSANAEAKPEALERGKHAIEEALKRRKIDAYVENANIHHYFRVRYPIKNTPLISIIIPFKDKPELLEMSIYSILEKSTYQNYEIIGISNNSEEPETFKVMKSLESKDNRVSFYEYNVAFNYSDINNHAVNTYAKGAHILLLNNDIEIISPDWLESMLELSQREEVGCVGAKLYYPNDTIQHAGIIMGLGGYAGHSHKMSPRESYGYFNRLSVIQNLSAVTAACLMIKKSIYDEVGGLDEVNFKVAYNDVDFCLRVREKGYLNLYTPYAEAYHHESISRGYEETPEKIARFQTEKDALHGRHRDILENGDPYYNPGLTHDKEDFSLCLK